MDGRTPESPSPQCVHERKRYGILPHELDTVATDEA